MNEKQFVKIIKQIGAYNFLLLNGKADKQLRDEWIRKRDKLIKRIEKKNE